MRFTFPIWPLRLGLRLLRLAQRGLSPREGRAVAHACRLRLAPAEQEAEAAIDALRRRLDTSDETVEVVDYGAGTRGGERPPVRDVREVYRRAATGPAWGRFLFGLTRALRPRRVLELGTNLGVGSAHLAAALALTEHEGGPAGRLVTLEGAPALAERAAEHLGHLGHSAGDDLADRVRIVVGPFAETLEATARAEGPFDLVFIDGHHAETAALAYVETLRPHLAEGALLVLDDVEPGRPVRRAWTRLRAARPGAPSFYAGKYGLLFHTEPEGDEGAAPAFTRETRSRLTEPAATPPAGTPPTYASSYRR